MSIVTYTNGERTAVFAVTIEHGQSLEEMIAAGCYDDVDPVALSVSFRIMRRSRKQTEITLIQFDRPYAPGELKALMEGRGYRPAFIEELLALGKEQPDLQRKIPIVALGSGRIIQGRRRSVVLGGSASSRHLQLAVIYRKWSIYYRFAFIRK
jgi:hypothetical protein